MTPQSDDNPASRDDSTATSRHVTRILQRVVSSEDARAELLPLVYEDLRMIARNRLKRERSDHTLQATALVHEAYMRLVTDRNLSWSQRASFYSAASEAMRRILVDYARRHKSQKRGEAKPRLPITLVDVPVEIDADQVLDLDEALTELEKEDARAAEIVRLRFFAGLSVEDTTEILGLSKRTVMREWSFARAWLYERLHPT